MFISCVKFFHHSHCLFFILTGEKTAGDNEMADIASKEKIVDEDEIELEAPEDDRDAMKIQNDEETDKEFSPEEDIENEVQPGN